MSETTSVTVCHADTCPVASPEFQPDIGPQQHCNCDFMERLKAVLNTPDNETPS